jgi:hypothetical protein
MLCESAKEQDDLRLKLAAGVVTSQPLFLRERARGPTGRDLRGPPRDRGTAGERGGKVGGKAAF